MESYAAKRVVVVGLGASGVAACRLLVRRGAKVTAMDAKPVERLSQEARALEAAGVTLSAGGHDGSALDRADLVVVSPGVPAFAELSRAEAKGTPIWGEVELAVRSLAHPAPVVAVGGTNGKSTTTSLVGELLSASGARVFVGGNLGDPLAEQADERFDVVVLEVSSFQMERVDRFRPKASALLNISEDHLDRYADFDAYARAKGNAFARQDEGDVAVVPVGDAICAREAARGRGRVVTFGAGGDVDVTPDAIEFRSKNITFRRSDVSLSGGHNALNVAAALALTLPFDVGETAMRGVLSSFRGLAHRMVLVRELAGVRYYDDSKGTNVGAAVTAVRGVTEDKVVLVCGGRDKGGSYGPLVDALRDRGRAAVLIGEASELIARAIGDAVPVRRAASMQEAVAVSRELARPGDAVLLSPACSSFDMFKDYKERGEVFTRAVEELAP
jgi:UDP-N-acetylmuramoylalanine--D-glutamate ligase